MEKEAQLLEERSTHLLTQEAGRRRDFRGIPTFTIDPDDAKDFDDALSVQKLPNGNFEVGIHIADVTFFVSEHSPLDQEAARRGTSVYLVDRTIPMLPLALSSDLCSLNPNEDKLTFSAVLELSPDGKIHKRWFGKTITRSKKRFTYEEAQKVLDTKRGPFFKELYQLSTLARKLRTKRFDAGAIAFEQEEVKFTLDKSGRPTRIFKKKRLETHKLIEDFMILANSEVARLFAEHDRNVEQTFIYRVHPLPEVDKIQELANLLQVLGYHRPKKHEQLTAKDLPKLLKEVEGEAHERIVQAAVIRAMAKAIYTTKNIGHFGLSLKHYTHFTSPIRRYPDIMVHRLLSRYLRGKPVPREAWSEYEALSRYATQMEITANEAEWDSIKYKQAEYMSERIGKSYEGVITGLIDRGIFVRENETLSEGMVRLRDIKDDYYVLDERTFSIVGKRKKRKYSLGDKVKIKVLRVNIEKRLIDYGLV